jgi:hypothetical protein
LQLSNCANAQAARQRLARALTTLRAVTAGAGIYSRAVTFFAVPLLASSDLHATSAFYRQLGFEELGAPVEEWDYLIVGYGRGELHFVGPSLGARNPGSAFVYVDDADSTYAEWRAKADSGARFNPAGATNFGMRAFTMFDLDDNEIRVGSPPLPRHLSTAQ